jgi:hypothetical protein
MKTKGILLLLLLSAQLVLAQSVPPITLRYSKLLATYDFVQRLPDSAPLFHTLRPLQDLTMRTEGRSLMSRETCIRR